MAKPAGRPRAEIEADIRVCQDQIGKLSKEIESGLKKRGSTKLSEVKSSELSAHQIKIRKVYRGHFGKIYALAWSQAEGKDVFVSASQDGKLIVWDAVTTNKRMLVPLQSAWVMTVAYSASGSLIGCGGLDNVCSIYKTANIPNAAESKGRATEPALVLSQSDGHDGYLACAKFVDDKNVVTTSGDQTLVLWDLNNGRRKMTFRGHTADVMSVAVNSSGNTFISGSCDRTAKVWDVRTGMCVQTHEGHEADINSVAMFPDDNAFGTGSDDSCCKLFDLRSWGEIAHFGGDRLLATCTSIAFSSSGRLLFGAYDDGEVQVFDVLKESLMTPLRAHESRVSALGINRGGNAIVTGSWDSTLRLFA